MTIAITSSVSRGDITSGIGVNQGVVVKIDHKDVEVDEEKSIGEDVVDDELRDRIIAWSCC